MSLEKVIITKKNLINEFVTFSKWVDEYRNFLLKNYNELQSHEVLDFLEKHNEHIQLLNIQFHLLDMVRLTLEFALSRITPENLTFMLPPSEQETITDPTSIIQRVKSDLNIIISLANNLDESVQAKLQPVLNKSDHLFCAIINQDSQEIEESLSAIQHATIKQGGEGMIGEVAKITRDIYNLFQDFTCKNEFDEIRSATQEMPDAVQKINVVMERLESAANQNLEYLEQFLTRASEKMQLCVELREESDQILETLQKIGEENPQLKASLTTICDQVENKIKKGYDSLIFSFQEDESYFIEMMANQGFQDLAGQTLKKIIDFMESLEMRLLELIREYVKFIKGAGVEDEGVAKLDSFTRVDKSVDNTNVELKGPDEVDQKSSQSDVDSLLAELGF